MDPVQAVENELRERDPVHALEIVCCPECWDDMPVARLDDRVLHITQGKCSECVAYPRRHAQQVERERRVAAFGEGRC